MNKKSKSSHASAITSPLTNTPSTANISISEPRNKPKKTLKEKLSNVFKKNKKKRDSKQHQSQQPQQQQPQTLKGGLPKRSASKINVSVNVVQSTTPTLDALETTCKSYRKTKEPKKSTTRPASKSKPCTSPSSNHNHPVQKELPEKSYEYRPPPVSVEKIEKSIQNLLEQIQPKCLKVFESQWEVIDEYEVKDEEINAFLEHNDPTDDFNQAEQVECLDVNRVKLEKNESIQQDYIHASYVEIKDIPRKFVLAQLPRLAPKRLEEFWSMIYQEKLHNIYLLCSPEESSKPDKFREYFPITSGEHEHYEQIWVHNRKVEMGTDSNDANDTYIIEVLPSGCAESILSTIQMLNYWPISDVGSKTKKILASASNVFGVADAYEGDPVGIISKIGAGRTGTYLAIVCAIHLMKNGKNIDMKELCTSIRHQRPGAIDNYFQFVFVYSMVLQFASQHVTNKDIKASIDKVNHTIEFILSKKNSEETTAKTTD